VVPSGQQFMCHLPFVIFHFAVNREWELANGKWKILGPNPKNCIDNLLSI